MNTFAEIMRLLAGDSERNNENGAWALWAIRVVFSQQREEESLFHEVAQPWRRWALALKCAVCIVLERDEPSERDTGSYYDNDVEIAIVNYRSVVSFDCMYAYEWDSIRVGYGWRDWWYTLAHEGNC